MKLTLPCFEIAFMLYIYVQSLKTQRQVLEMISDRVLYTYIYESQIVV